MKNPKWNANNGINPQGYTYGGAPVNKNPFWAEKEVGNIYINVDVDDTTGTPEADVERTIKEDGDVVFDIAFSGLKGKEGNIGPQGTPGTPGAPGAKGDPGEGVPAGGTAGQVLTKYSGADYETYWQDLPPIDFTANNDNTQTVLTNINHLTAQKNGNKIKIQADKIGGLNANVEFGAVPVGGSAGYILKKRTASDYDFEWGEESGGSSGSGFTSITIPKYESEDNMFGMQAIIDYMLANGYKEAYIDASGLFLNDYYGAPSRIYFYKQIFSNGSVTATLTDVTQDMVWYMNNTGSHALSGLIHVMMPSGVYRAASTFMEYIPTRNLGSVIGYYDIDPAFLCEIRLSDFNFIIGNFTQKYRIDLNANLAKEIGVYASISQLGISKGSLFIQSKFSICFGFTGASVTGFAK